jgi:HD-GYP domain-containing protein (c-di-GMP phosphodiesterase class II)
MIALADAYSSMTAPRPHGRALDPAAALRALDTLAGNAFDPDLTACLAGGATHVVLSTGKRQH